MTNLNEICDEKLALNNKLDKISPEFMKIAHEGVLKFGKVSIPYLMRKLKCSPSMAKDIICQLDKVK